MKTAFKAKNYFLIYFVFLSLFSLLQPATAQVSQSLNFSVDSVENSFLDLKQDLDAELTNLFQNNPSPHDPTFESLIGAAWWKKLLWEQNSTLKNQSHQENDQPTIAQLITRAGFKSQTHFVTSEDGYILQLDRILGRNDKKTREKRKIAGNFYKKDENGKKPVALLVPGLLACGDSWLIGGANRSLGFLLANLDFDVWVVSPRGCFYSRSHVSKNPDSPEFWNFSWHEMGVYDMPKIISFILKETGQSKLNYIGHSMGTTVQFVMLSEKPEYNQKINMSINMGTAVNFKHFFSPLARDGAHLSRFMPRSLISEILSGGSGELLPRTGPFHKIVKEMCELIKMGICRDMIYITQGFDECQDKETLTPELLDFFPTGSSVWAMMHYAQLINSGGEFRKFDHGIIRNLIEYGRRTPPVYNLRNVRAPQIFFYADNDWLSHPKDVAQTSKNISPEANVSMCRIKWRYFNHIDYLIAKDVNVLLNQRVVQVLLGRSCNAGEMEEESIKCPHENNNGTTPDPFKTVLEYLEKNLNN